MAAGLLAVAQTVPARPAFPGAGIINEQPRFATAVYVNRPDGIYRERDILRVEFGCHVESCLYLLYHTVDGQTNLMFPNGLQTDNRIPAETLVAIPPDDGNYVFRVAPPLGQEVLQVLASQQPLPELDNLVKAGGRSAVVPAAVLSSLQSRLLKEPATWAEHRMAIETIPGDAPAPAVMQASRVGLFIGIGKYRDPETSPTHEELRHSAVVLHDLMLEAGWPGKGKDPPAPG